MTNKISNPNDNFFYGTLFSYNGLFIIWFLTYLRMVYSKTNDSFLYKLGLLLFFILCISFRLWLDLKYTCEPISTSDSFSLYMKSLLSSMYLLFPMGILQKLTTIQDFLSPFANTIGYLLVYSKIKAPVHRLIQSYKNKKSNLTPEENVYFEMMTNHLDILINILTPSNLSSDTSVLDKLNLNTSEAFSDDIQIIQRMTNIRFLIAEAIWFVLASIITYSNILLYIKSYRC